MNAALRQAAAPALRFMYLGALAPKHISGPSPAEPPSSFHQAPLSQRTLVHSNSMYIDDVHASARPLAAPHPRSRGCLHAVSPRSSPPTRPPMHVRPQDGHISRSHQGPPAPRASPRVLRVCLAGALPASRDATPAIATACPARPQGVLVRATSCFHFCCV